MSVEAFSGLPFQAGQAVATAAGRTALWVIAAYMRAPLRNTAIAALVSLSAMAGSNALYKQSGHHPAPLFGTFDAKPAKSHKAVEPVMPAERPIKLLQTTAPADTTGSVEAPSAVSAETIGSEDVFEVQRKLTAFKLFTGKVDGLYGPRTARSVKAFEQSLGRAPTGKLTTELVDLIKSTPIIAEPAKAEAAPALEARQPASVAVDTGTDAPLALVETAEPLPAPSPLLGTADAIAAEPQPAEEAVAAIDPTPGASAVNMTMPAPNAPAKRAVQTIAVRAVAPAPAQQMPDVLTKPIDVTKVDSDPTVVGAVQRGLASLGFLHGEINGVAGEATAKAIRNFEVYYNYNVTGRITPELVNLLVQNGAVI